MIKRRFYRVEHGERDDASSDSSSSSSSSSDSDSDSEIEEPHVDEPQPDDDDIDNHHDDHDGGDGDDDDDEKRPFVKKPQLPSSSSSSGYESEDSSAHEIDALSEENDGELLNDSPASRQENGGIVGTLTRDHSAADNVPGCILKCKSIFKCRICPKIVCLNEESLKVHLASKRHARSQKLQDAGRLKRILNSDGEEEVLSDDDGETHAERHARIVALAEAAPKSKGKGRQRQRKRLKRKKEENSTEQKENRATRRRKKVD